MGRLNKPGLERDLFVISVLTLILILVVSISSITWLRILFGLPFILFFPGYTLIAAFFPRKEGLSGIERIAFSFGLSIALVSLIGLILNYAWSIDLYPVLVSLSLFILSMSAIAWYKRRNCLTENRFRVSFLYRQHLSDFRWHEIQRLDKWLYILLVVAVLGAVGTAAYAAITPNEEEKFTEFYILGPEGKAENYPVNLEVGEIGKVELGIINREHETTSYRVEVWIGEEPEEIETGSLSHEEEWQREVEFSFAELPGSTTLSEPAAQGQSTLMVKGTDDLQAGDYIQIAAGKENDELVQIENIDVDTSEITISEELKFDHAEGDQVVEKQRVEFRLFKNQGSEPYLTLYLYVEISPAI